MIHHFEVAAIEIIEDADAFAEWATASEPQDRDDIERWEAAYFAEIAKELRDEYPTAFVTVESSRSQENGQFVTVKRIENETPDSIDIDDNGWASGSYLRNQAEEEVKNTISWILDNVSNAGKFWEA